MTQRRIYQCAHQYHITFNILNREWFFDNKAKAKLLHEIILNAGDIKNHIVYQFCIMPDHVHLLCRTNEDSQVVGSPCTHFVFFPPRTLESVRCGGDQTHHRLRRCDAGTGRTEGGTCGATLSDFIQSIKGTFSRKIHMGHIWQRRFHDEIIGTDKQLSAVIAYITHNHVKAGLPERWGEYPYQ
jgi:REP element-mobilizing transposase RayT